MRMLMWSGKIFRFVARERPGSGRGRLVDVRQLRGGGPVDEPQGPVRAARPGDRQLHLARAGQRQGDGVRLTVPGGHQPDVVRVPDRRQGEGDPGRRRLGHTYWNLDGFANTETNTALNHTFYLPYSGQRIDVDNILIPTGNILANQPGSVNDFWSEPKQIGKSFSDPEIENNCGFGCSGYGKLLSLSLSL